VSKIQGDATYEQFVISAGFDAPAAQMILMQILEQTDSI